jgi:hypothetical protein
MITTSASLPFARRTARLSSASVPVGDDYSRTGLGQRVCAGKADPAGAAGHEGDATSQLEAV